MVFRIFLALFTVMSVAGFAKEIKDESTGLTFPEKVTIEKDGKTYQLSNTGVATRRKLIVKVYSIASYLQDGAYKGGDKLEALQGDASAKQLIIKFNHDVSADKLRNSFLDAFKNNLSPADYASLQPTIDKTLGVFTDVKPGDEMVISALPGGYVEVKLNGKQLTSDTNAAFAKALWATWVGPNSVIKRENLVSNLQ